VRSEDKNKMDNVLLDIAKQFNKNAVSVELLTKCRNTIYKVNCANDMFVLRVSSEKHRNAEQIKSELDFQRYLYNNGAAVSKPLQTEAGETCLPFEMDNSNFIGSAFEYIEGKGWDERKDNSEEIFIIIGRTLGKIHRLSKVYKPLNVIKRRLWSEQQELLTADILKKHSAELYDKYLYFMRKMNKEEKTENTFGLTHGDYLVSNYLIDDENNITVIDFDECEYSWFAADLAICMRAYLFWTENPATLPTKANEAEIIHYNLLLGYSSENTITKSMVYDLEKYIKIRDYIELASQLSFEPEIFNDYPIEKILYEMNLDRIVNDKPFLEFNITKAEKLLTQVISNS
jgi:Ser/Thr protein kinase RdoA (MazF antagonist)